MTAPTGYAPASAPDPTFTPPNREEISANVGSMIDDARAFIGEELDGLRAKATDYYMGRPFGNEEEGRSQVVSTDVRDTVQAVLPSLMRVFFNPEHVVEFKPRRADGEPQAAQATEYINYIITEDNQGFREILAAFKDALVRKTGIIKWWWEKSTRVEGSDYTGLSDDNLAQLSADPEVKIEITGIEPAQPPTYAARVRRTIVDDKARIAACPPETISWNRSARSFEQAQILVHTEDRPLWELLQMGYPRQTLEEAGFSNARYLNEQLDVARRFNQDTKALAENYYDQDSRLVRYDEAYVYLKLNETDGTCLYKVCFVGDSHVMVGEPEKLTERPFALFVADPEPHTVIGLDYADYTEDIQKIKSMIWRGSLDSLSLSLTPRVEAVEGQVNTADLLNTEIGAVIRVRQPGMVREVKHSFVGADALPMIQYADEVKENRTGISKAAAGLDPAALQSSTKMGVAMTYTAAQQHMELLARIFAETGFRTLMRGLLRLVVTHQDRPRTIRLMGEYVEIDPRAWDATMDVTINVALGAGMVEERLATLQAIKEAQEQVLTMLGPANPLCSLAQYRHTLARMTELAGFKNAAEFWKEITPEMEKAMDAAAAAAPKDSGDPAAMALAEVEKQKVQVAAMKAAADVEIAQRKAQIEEQDMHLKDDRERDASAAQITLKLQEQGMEHTHAMERARLDSAMALDKARIDAEVALEKARIEAASRERVAGINAEATRAAAKETRKVAIARE